METSLTRRRAVWDATSEALAFSDPEGIVQVVNSTYCVRYRRPAVAVVGHSVARIFPKTNRAMALTQYRTIFRNKRRSGDDKKQRTDKGKHKRKK